MKDKWGKELKKLWMEYTHDENVLMFEPRKGQPVFSADGFLLWLLNDKSWPKKEIKYEMEPQNRWNKLQ